MKKIIAFLLLVAIVVGCKEVKGNNDPPPTVDNIPRVEENVPQPVFVDFGEEVVKKAKEFQFVRETNGPNRSPEIDKFHDYAGLPYGNPWCLMYVNYMYHLTLSPYGFEPYTKTARVSYLYKYALKHKYLYQVKFDKALAYGAQEAEPGDMVIWLKNYNENIIVNDANPSGHVGLIIEEIEPGKFRTIEGNTSSGDSGSQRDGDGVFVRIRTINLTAGFRIEALVKPLYPETEKK